MIQSITWALLALGGLVTLLWALNVARRAGRDQERSEGQEKVIENVEKSKRAVRSLSDPERRKRLHEKYGSK